MWKPQINVILVTATGDEGEGGGGKRTRSGKSIKRCGWSSETDHRPPATVCATDRNRADPARKQKRAMAAPAGPVSQQKKTLQEKKHCPTQEIRVIENNPISVLL